MYIFLPDALFHSNDLEALSSNQPSTVEEFVRGTKLSHIECFVVFKTSQVSMFVPMAMLSGIYISHACVLGTFIYCVSFCSVVEQVKCVYACTLSRTCVSKIYVALGVHYIDNHCSTCSCRCFFCFGCLSLNGSHFPLPLNVLVHDNIPLSTSFDII